MKRILFKIGIFLNWLFAVLLLFSDFSVFISPDRIPYLALLGLLFPFLIIINCLFLIFRIFYKKPHFFISLLALLLSFYRISDFYSFKNKEVISTPVNSLKVMSYNVRMFDLYNWTGENAGKNILEVIKNENADIICLQEFYSSDKLNYQDEIIKFQQTKGYVISSKNKTGYSGNAIFSMYPIISSGFVDLGNTKQKCIYADIVKKRDTVRIYSIHLASIHLDDNDYDFIEKINENSKDDNIEGVKGISNKLLEAYKIRAGEVEKLVPNIASSPYPVIVCGDFNDTPVSYTYRNIKGDLKDAFLESGIGIGHTYAKGLPLFRIDYILHDKKMTSKSYKRNRKKFSDHYPISCEIEL
ncbi:MAG: endonuclease/exonuclease/phosphatase family protein [Chlorobi bacterium]|nr:endonuclease/exonuclease/phosphatase family protein [Chlorobiota bacterium]